MDKRLLKTLTVVSFYGIGQSVLGVLLISYVFCGVNHPV